MSKLCIYYHKIKGISIHTSCKAHLDIFLSLGYANGRGGQLIIQKDCELSKGVIIKCYGGEIHIDQNVFIGEFVAIYGHGGVNIGNNTLISMHTCIISSNHTIPPKKILIRSQPDIPLPVNIGADVWIGANVKILGGVTIGNGCVIGAGSVVTKDIPDNSLAVGNPAKVIRKLNV